MNYLNEEIRNLKTTIANIDKTIKENEEGLIELKKFRNELQEELEQKLEHL